jgi:uncharacterized membrane protein HdeD (DUF308 family)
MNSKISFGTPSILYILGLLLILIGLILINVDFNYLDYSMLGIGIVLLVLGINEAIKPF